MTLANRIDLNTGQGLQKGFGKKAKKVERTQYINELWWEKHLKKEKATKQLTRTLKDVENHWKKYSGYTNKELISFFKGRNLFFKTKEEKKFLKTFTHKLNQKQDEIADWGGVDNGGWNDYLSTESFEQKTKADKKRIADVIEKLRTHWSFYKRWSDGSLFRWFDAEGCFKDKNLFRRSSKQQSHRYRR